MRPLRRIAVPVVVLLCTSLLPVVALAPALAQRPNTVVLGMAQEPDVLAHPFTLMGAADAVLNSLHLFMVQRDPQGRLFPRLVEKIPTIQDGDWQLLPDKKMKVTYRIRRGYTWHDGRPVTALDAAWTYLMLRNPRTPTVSRALLRKIDNVLVPDPNDPYTLIVQWNERYPYANIQAVIYPILPRHVLERAYLADASRLNRHQQVRAPVGNGPYRFVEWVPGSHITLEAFERFAEGKPKIHRQVWRFILDSTVLQANVIAGQADVTVANNFSIDQMLDIERRNPQVTAYYLPSFGWEHIPLNLDNEWLKDRRVRHALIHAINREELNQRLYYGKQRVAHTWLPPGHEGHNANVRQYPYDPARARQLLTEGGFVPGADGILRDASGKRFELTIMTTAGHAGREQVQQIMKDQLRAVGVDLKIDNRPASVLFGTVVRRRQFPHMTMFNTGFNPLSLGLGWHSSQIPSAANNYDGGNSMGWRNAENDRLMEQIGEELDAPARIRLLHRQQEVMAEDLPVIPLFFTLALSTTKRSLRNVRPSVLGGILYRPDHWEWSQ